MTDTQRTLATIGTRPHTVRVMQRTRDGRTVVMLEWREMGVRQRRVIADADSRRETVATARAQAKALHARLVRGELPSAPAPVAPASVTVADVYNAHVALRGDAWRPRTRELAADAYRAWAAWAGAHTDVTTQRALDLTRFRRALVELGREPSNAVRECQRVRAFYRSAIEAGLIESHPFAMVRIAGGKEAAPKRVPEFTPDATARVVARFDHRKRTQWRAWAATVLASVLGPRPNALLAQAVANVDRTARVIHWPSATDKMGKERTQALPRAAMHALRVIAVWHAREGYTGPWLFPSPQWRTTGDRKPWTYAAWWLAITKACADAGVPRAHMQAMHAFRRFATNQVLRATGGDVAAASYWIGDSDLRVLQRSYLRERPEDAARIVAALNGPRTAPTPDAPDAADTETLTR